MNINIEFDILMFLANNPDFRTARDIKSIDRLLSGLDEEARQKFMEVLSIMNQNLDDILK